MQRFFALIVLLLFAFPVGLSITGCRTNVDAYCNNEGYGPKVADINAVTLSGGTTGISLSYGQIGTAGTASATNCKGTRLSTGAAAYGSSNINLVDINPTTGALCAGTWNRLSAGGIPDFTICTPATQPGTVQVTGSIGGVSSNPVIIYVHPAISSITIPDPGGCVSQNVVAAQPLTTGTVVFDTDGNPIDPAYIGTISYAAVTPSIVTINDTTATTSTAAPNGTATANMPGATVITASIPGSKVTSSAGYFYTCPPASIGLTVNGATSATITAGNPQNINATIPDTAGNAITGLALDYTSTQPQEIAVAATGALSSAFPGAAAVTAICQPGTCNPAPINKIGTFGTGLPIVSNRIGVTSPGTGNTLLWAASPASQFFTPFDLSLGTVGTPIHLPYLPNSMRLDQAGNNLYFGSYRELMIYSATTNALSKEDTTVPGVVLAVSPDSTTVVVNDQLRQVIYLYTQSTGANISIGGLATRAVYSPDSKNVYIVGPTTLYVHNSTTGWSTYPISTTEPAETCTLDNNNLNPFCSPDLALSVPAVSPFLSGTQTTARSFCPSDLTTQPPYYPLAATIAAETDHLTATNDGAHIIGATATNIVDIEHSPTTDTNRDLVPSGTCPYNATVGADPLSVPPLQLATTFNQLALTNIAPTQIDQVLAAPNSAQVFFTYTAPAATGLLPLYVPSATAGAAGTLTYVQLASGAVDPIAGVFSPDIQSFFVSTTGDNLIHQLSTGALTDTDTLNPELRDTNNNLVPAKFLVVRPRPTT
jgi:hypothetical protein